jgi:hypothetical protein
MPLTIGQVTFEAVKTSVNNWSADFARLTWSAMPEGEKNGWETAGQAIEAFYETGAPGER